MSKSLITQLTPEQLFDNRPGIWSARSRQTREMARLLKWALDYSEELPQVTNDEMIFQWQRDVRKVLGGEVP